MADSLKSAFDPQDELDHHRITRSPAFEEVRQEVLRLAAPKATDRCLDLGSGAGDLALPLAGLCASVLALGGDPPTAEALEWRARESGLDNVQARASDLSLPRLPRRSLDVVVSCYALHHVPDHQKRELVALARTWLAPGGRLVVADRMFGRTLGAADRRILLAKVKDLASQGPSGLWRIGRNLIRLALDISDEHPAPPEFWKRAFEDAGFLDIGHRQVVQEAGIVWGRVPLDH